MAQPTDSARLIQFPLVRACCCLVRTVCLPLGAQDLHHPINIQEKPVAANCDVCGKGPGFGHNISHSHRRTKRRWNPNIQRVKALVGVAGVTPKRLNVCTSCLKAGKVKR